MASPQFDEWFQQFGRTGDICPLKIGMSRDEVRGVLGEPDDVSTVTKKNRIPAIWKYGQLEFHFGHRPEDTLFLIYRENDSLSDVVIPEIIIQRSDR